MAGIIDIPDDGPLTLAHVLRQVRDYELLHDELPDQLRVTPDQRVQLYQLVARSPDQIDGNTEFFGCRLIGLKVEVEA